ncbi:MAG: hypothetical protein LC541_13335 [Candidatus Thiodiazotropha sp.]|nr:hypothetical protein [Candidatus Thiodiazotropha sp.]MCM8884255.1 hypothetical protein [Candidatus Thiodiazotropha sp.]MCM8919863.1 hypothetical protein [Candidatus Thiodiazotropha sp.]MCU7874014.1 hypothetical protein [Candidatus Thiodiazotropha sp. (ex Lucinoma borealis)]MCU7884028.1 hypothetical protein [Candidatus Thiodiazotropha sp. (ex Lucinoma annulata)]
MGKTTIIILIVLVALLVSGVAIARYKGYCAGPEGRIGWVADRIGRQLDLNDSQQQHLALFKERAVMTFKELRSDRSVYVDQAIELLESPAFDRDRAHTLLMQKQAQLASVSNDLIDAFAEFSDNLDQSQRDKLQSMIKHHRDHRHCQYGCGDSKAATQD